MKPPFAYYGRQDGSRHRDREAVTNVSEALAERDDVPL